MAGGWAYVIANRPNGTLYVGVTSDLTRRVWKHRIGAVDGFTKRYGLKRLVYAEPHSHIGAAIQREKVLKHWPPLYEIRLIETANPLWDDLYNQLI
jgi:putative endonuclease